MKYLVSGYLTISACAVVEAENKEEAKEKALQLGTPTLCYQCCNTGHDCDSEWGLNGFDDPPKDAVQDVEEME